MQIVSRNTNVIHLASVSDNLETTWSIGNDEFLLWRHDRQNRLLWMLVRGIRNELHGITGFSPNPPTNRDGSFGDEVCRQQRRGSSRSFTSFSSLVPLWKIPTLLLAVGLRRLCEAEPSGCDRSYHDRSANDTGVVVGEDENVRAEFRRKAYGPRQQKHLRNRL